MLKQTQRKLTYVPISEVTTNRQNPRRHAPAQVEAIANSIRQFGFNAPLVLDNNNCLVVGHGRFEAAKLLELIEVPTIRLEDLSEAEARAYMIADNRLTELSTWDEPLLALHFKELSELSLDFDLAVTGFEAPEIDLRIQALSDPRENDEADTFELSEAPPVSRLGDLWDLGDHRLYCGSALEESSYTALLDGSKASSIFTDPPYNVPIQGNVSGLGRKKHREFEMASGEMSPSAFTEFLRRALDAAKRHTNAGAIIYACMDWRHIDEILAARSSAGLELLNLCVWVKPNGGMGSFYRSRHELVFVFRHGRQKHRNNVQLGRFGRNRTNVWNYPGANCFGRMANENVLALHPTVKPIGLVVDAILDATGAGETVLDPFCGSGTTLLAAERSRRKGRGIELDPRHVDTAIARWERMTGKAAVHGDGLSFTSVRDRRAGDR